MCFLLDFMASAATRSQLVTKFLLVFLGLVFILPLHARSISFPKKSMAELSSPQLKHAPTSSSGASSGFESAGKQFKAAAHEVPSGPNPESN